MRLVHLLAITPLLSLNFLLSGCDSPPENQGAAAPPAVTVSVVKKSEIRPSNTFTGRVEAVDSVELKARISGYLTKRLAKEGAYVKAGELLFEIEKDNYQADVSKVQGALLSLRGQRDLAVIELKRRQKLVKTSSIAQEEVDVAQANLKTVDGEIMTQQAALKRAGLNLSYTEIQSPIDGRLGLTPFSEGDFVGPLSPPLATVVSQDPIYVTFPVSQRELLAVRSQGKTKDSVEVKVQLADGSFYEKVGFINFVDVEADPTTDTTQLRAEFSNPDNILVHRQLVNVTVEQAEAELALTIPQPAIQLDQIGKYVLLVDAENKVQVQRIQTGRAIDGNVVITDGLSEGDRVITQGIQKVRPGLEVAPAEENAAEGSAP